jgi:hypothetical protein
MWIFAAVPLGTVYLQDEADVRSYRDDPACVLGISAPPEPGSDCGVGTVIVAAARKTAADTYVLSLKFADGARRELPISASGYRYLHVPGTLAFVQVRAHRVALVGDERYVEMTPEHPERRLPGARNAALAALVLALGASALAFALVRRDARSSFANDRV